MLEKEKGDSWVKTVEREKIVVEEKVIEKVIHKEVQVIKEVIV